MADLRDLLLEAGLALREEALAGLERYHTLLLEWNEKMDLTSVSQQDMAARHFLDSLLPLKIEGMIPENGRLIDVGTGAGFPGLPLAIARPELQVTLLEAQGKRCKFLAAVCEALKLENVEIINDRAEILGRAAGYREGYDRAVARAVAPLNILCEYLLPFVKEGGAALCWKGPALKEELGTGRRAAHLLGGRLEMPVSCAVAGREWDHMILPIRKVQHTASVYPRKAGSPKSKPLGI